MENVSRIFTEPRGPGTGRVWCHHTSCTSERGLYVNKSTRPHLLRVTIRWFLTPCQCKCRCNSWIFSFSLSATGCTPPNAQPQQCSDETVWKRFTFGEDSRVNTMATEYVQDSVQSRLDRQRWCNWAERLKPCLMTDQITTIRHHPSAIPNFYSISLQIAHFLEQFNALHPIKHVHVQCMTAKAFNSTVETCTKHRKQWSLQESHFFTSRTT